MTNEKQAQQLPNEVLARWKAEDWNDETMTASHYSYEDGEGNPIELSEQEVSQYSWGNCEDNITGGSQGGWLRDDKPGPEVA